MDLGKRYDTVAGSNEGFDCQLFAPDAQRADLPVFITILGQDSEQFKATTGEQNRKRIARNTKGGRYFPTPMSLQDVEREQIELLVSCTTGWYTAEALDPKVEIDYDDPSTFNKVPVIEVHGEKLEFSKKNCEKLYRALPWVREQIDAAMGNRANFLKGSKQP